MNEKILKISFWFSVCSSLFLFPLVFFVEINLPLFKESETAKIIFEIVSTVDALTMLIAFIILWANGWSKLLRYWSYRTKELNAGLTFFLLFGSMFAAYYFYFSDGLSFGGKKETDAGNVKAEHNVS